METRRKTAIGEHPLASAAYELRTQSRRVMCSRSPVMSCGVSPATPDAPTTPLELPVRTALELDADRMH